MTDSKPRRLSLPSKPQSTEPRSRPPIRGVNKDLKPRGEKPPRPAREDRAERPRREGEFERRDERRGPRFEGSSESQAGRGSWTRDAKPRTASPREDRNQERPRFRDQDRAERPRFRQDEERHPRFRADEERRPRPDFRERSDSEARREPRREGGFDRRDEHRGPRFESASEGQTQRGSWNRDAKPRTAGPREDRNQEKPRFRDQDRAERPRFHADEERRPRPDFRERAESEARLEPRREGSFERRGERPTRRFEGASESQTGRGSWSRDAKPRTAGPREDRTQERPRFRDQGRAERPRFGQDEPRRFRSDDDRRPRFHADEERRPRPDFRERGDSDARREPRREGGFDHRDERRGPRFEGASESQTQRGSWNRDAKPRTAAPHEHEEGTVRLSKRMTDLGLCSRREADEYIERGWVKVDGAVVDELGSRVREDQHIELDAQAEITQNERITVLINKPIGYVSGQAEDGYEPASVLLTNENHWEEDPCRIRLEPRFLRKLAPAGRLDIDSTGLLVLTQDGRIAKQLIGNHSEIEKEYLVRVEGHLSDEGMRLLNHGLELDGVELQPAKVSWQNEDQLRFVLREGRKRQIRRMCELVGLRVVGLKRIRIGRITLSKLPPGQWRYLGEHEKF